MWWDITRIAFNGPACHTDCNTAMERADKILQLLRANGLDSEPTIENCRLLRKEVVTNEEVRDLDPSLIIQTEGRTRRSAARAAGTRDAATGAAAGSSGATAPTADAAATAGPVQVTLTKIKTLVDSESDDE